MVSPPVGMVYWIFRLWFFSILLIVVIDLSHESFDHWNLLNRVIRSASILCKSSQDGFWVIPRRIGPFFSWTISHIPYEYHCWSIWSLSLHSQLRQFPFPFAFYWVSYWAEGGWGGGRPLVLWMFSTMMRSSCSCWVKQLCISVNSFEIFESTFSPTCCLSPSIFGYCRRQLENSE